MVDDREALRLPQPPPEVPPEEVKTGCALRMSIPGRLSEFRSGHVGFRDLHCALAVSFSVLETRSHSAAQAIWNLE